MKTKTLVILFVIVMVLVLASVPLVREKGREPITITSYASVAQMSLDEIIIKSDLIVIGEFKSIHSSRWNTSNGKLPENATLEIVSRQRLIIFTDANFLVGQFLKGDIQKQMVRIRTFGGRVGQDSMIVSDEPSYEPDQIYLLFLSRDTGSTATVDPGDYLTTGVYQGVYEITDGKALSRNDEWILADLITYIENVISNAQ